MYEDVVTHTYNKSA